MKRLIVFALFGLAACDPCYEVYFTDGTTRYDTLEECERNSDDCEKRAVNDVCNRN